MTTSERFWAKVDKDNPGAPIWNGTKCWLWMAHCGRGGYGRFGISNTVFDAHRIAWLLLYGPTFNHVLHHCDNRRCVKPSHLFEGTAKDNIHDMMSKGRQNLGRRDGENNNNAKLTLAMVNRIRARYRAGGVSMANIAKDYSVTEIAIWSILHHKTWAKATSAA